MQIVIDTSALLAVLLDEPERPAVIGATRGAVLMAPACQPWEVGNALVALVRRKRLTANEAVAAWKTCEDIPRRLLDVDIAEAIEIAVEFGLCAYDAYFLVLARERRLPLLTLDARMQSTAVLAGIGLVEFET